MKKYRFLSSLLALSVLLSLLVLPASALETPELQCRNAILMDAHYGEVLYEKDGYAKAYPASITKVMTALLTLEAIEAGQLTEETQVTADPDAVTGFPSDSSTANIKGGEVLTVRELLYCLLLPSANEAANILAEAVDGTIPDFVAHMNRRAGELGAQGTHFVNPHGLHNDQHYTTAYDIALFMQAALKHDLFREIIASPSHRVPATNQSEERVLYNTNGLVSGWHYGGYIYDKCIGGKTGSTPEAGRCLVSVAESGDNLLISVILGSGPIPVEGYSDLRQGQFTESTKLLKWGLSSFERVTITQGSEPVDKVAVTLSRQADEVMVKPQGSITRTLPKDVDLKQLETKISLFSPTVEAPVQEGQVLGVMKLSYQGEDYGQLDLVAVNAVERSELLYKKMQIVQFFQRTWVKLLLLLVLVAAVFVLLRLLVFRKRRRYRSSMGGSRARGNYRGARR